MVKSPHGICVIFNNSNCYSLDQACEPLPERGGTEIDQNNLIKTFEYFGYHVRVCENLNLTQMFDVMKEISKMDHSPYDSFICCILTFGEEGRIIGADGQPVDLWDFTGMMNGNICSLLNDKPKVFFIQAGCRDDKDTGIYIHPEKGKVHEDSRNPSLTMETDFIFGYATTVTLEMEPTAVEDMVHG